MKRGFTLVEIIVVLGIFGILMIVATDFFISTIQNSNRASIQTEVRQNAQKIMQDMVQEIRQADRAVVITLPTGEKDLFISSGSAGITYHTDKTTGIIYKNGSQMNSNSVIVLNCHGITCGLTCAVPYPDPNFTLVNGTVGINLVVQQKVADRNSVYCAVTTLNDTATPRLY